MSWKDAPVGAENPSATAVAMIPMIVGTPPQIEPTSDAEDAMVIEEETGRRQVVSPSATDSGDATLDPDEVVIGPANTTRADEVESARK
jgi:hypothetical protein